MPKNTCKPWKGPPKKRSLTYRFLYHFRVKGSRGIVGFGLPRGDMRARIARVGRPPRYDPKSCEAGSSGCGIFHRVRFGPHSDKTSCALGAPPSMKMGAAPCRAVNGLFSVGVEAIFIAVRLSGVGGGVAIYSPSLTCHKRPY